MVLRGLQRVFVLLAKEGWIELVRRTMLFLLLRTRTLIEYLRDLLLLPYAIRQVRSFESSHPHAVLDFAYGLLRPAFAIRKNYRIESPDPPALLDVGLGVKGILHPMQVPSEILPLLETLAHLSPRVVLEIGTFRGGTLFLFSRVASSQALMISIDLPGGPFHGGYPEWKIPFFLAFAKAGQSIRLFLRDSHLESTFHEIQEVLGERKIDFLFIDGDHTYEGAKKDFEMYGTLVAADGLIAFHDIMSARRNLGGGVNRFWNELKHQGTYSELVSNADQTSCGIGLLFMSGSSEYTSRRVRKS